MNWIPWLILGGVALVGTAIAVSKSSTPSATPSASGGGWNRATTINPADHVRITMDPSTFATVVQSMPQLMPTQQMPSPAVAMKMAWQSLLSQVHATLTANSSAAIQAWAPGDALPTDWPTDDAHASDGYHAQFDYIGPVPLPVSTLPMLVTVWTMPGVSTIPAPFGPGSTQTVSQGLLHNAGGPAVVQLQAGNQSVTVDPTQALTLQASPGAVILSAQHPGRHALQINANPYTFAAGTFSIGTSASPSTMIVTWGYGNSLTTMTTNLAIASS